MKRPASPRLDPRRTERRKRAFLRARKNAGASYEQPRGDFDNRGPRDRDQAGFGYDNRETMDRGHNDHNDGDNFRRDRDRDFGEWQQPWHQWQGDRFGGNGQLPRWVLVRRLEAQGYYHVSNLMPGRFGYGWRAFAYYHFSPVVLRLDPCTGRVLTARYV